MKTIKINGQIFNADWAKSVKENDFVKNLISVPFWTDLTTEEKDKKLREAWKLINGKLKEAPKAE